MPQREQILRVARGIVRRRAAAEDTILLLQRSTHCARNVGKWELPGGKCEEDQTLEDTLRRELVEETGLRIHRTTSFIRSSDELLRGNGPYEGYRRLTYTSTVFTQDATVQIDPIEHQCFGWFTFSQCLQMELASSSRDAIQLLL